MEEHVISGNKIGMVRGRAKRGFPYGYKTSLLRVKFEFWYIRFKGWFTPLIAIFS